MSESGFFAIKNWEEYQHYGKRNPPWIKFYTSLLDNYEYGQIADEDKAVLPLLFLVAARCQNHIPNDLKWLQKTMSLKKPPDLNLLVSLGFITMEQDDSNALASCKQDDSVLCKQDDSVLCKQDDSVLCKQDDSVLCKQDDSVLCKQDDSALCYPSRDARASSLSLLSSSLLSSKEGGAGGGEQPTAKAIAKKSKPKPQPVVGFDEFWALYPRKEGKKIALTTWEKIAPDNGLLEEILTALRWQVQREDWRKDGGRYIPHPRTWLSQERWTDEEPVIQDEDEDDGQLDDAAEVMEAIDILAYGHVRTEEEVEAARQAARQVSRDLGPLRGAEL